MMRYLLLVFALLTSALFAQPDTLLQRANEAYNAGDYATAITLYEGLLSAGYQDATVYFNLGNAYFESDDLGWALVHYRYAQAYIPRDFDLNRNLALVRALRVDVQGDETSLIDTAALLTESVMTRGELAVFAISLWALWFALLSIWIVRPQWRRRVRLWLVVGGMVTGSTLVLLLGRLYVDAERPPAVVVAFQVEAMSGPGEGYVPLFTLYSAAEGRALEQRAGWVRLLLPDGRQGWFPQESIAIIS